MPRKVSESEKKAILDSFTSGNEIKDIAKKYNFSTATITRQLRKFLSKNDFENIKQKNKNVSITSSDKSHKVEILQENKINSTDNLEDNIFEIIPLLHGEDLYQQKDLSSEPLSGVKLPEVVYLIVDKNIELVPKLLKDYPEWSYMPEEDLKRMTLKIFADQRNAKKNLHVNFAFF